MINLYKFGVITVGVSCDLYHTLVLTHNNEVYGWGRNHFGQIGSRDTTCNAISIPERVHFPDNNVIQSVHCFSSSSFALTTDGRVFSWGHNHNNQLGLNSNELMICRPQLICNLHDITRVTSGAGESYFLSSDHRIYFCGEYMNNDNNIDIQMTPKLLSDNNNKYADIQTIRSNKWGVRLYMCLMDNTVYKLFRGQQFSREFTNYFDYCVHKLQIIHKTYHLNEFTDSVLKFCTNIIQYIKRDSKELMHKNEGFIYN